MLKSMDLHEHTLFFFKVFYRILAFALSRNVVCTSLQLLCIFLRLTSPVYGQFVLNNFVQHVKSTITCLFHAYAGQQGMEGSEL